MSILRDLDELTAFEKLALIPSSYSRMDTLQSCEAKYFYTYIQNEPRSSGAAASMGTAGHSVLEDTDLNDMDLKVMLARLETEFVTEETKEGQPEGFINDELREAARQCLIDFFDRHNGDKFEKIDTEYKFNVVLGNCYFTGYIDRIDKTPDGGIQITDWKFGKHQVAQKNASQNLQIGLYAVVARKFFPELWPIRADLYYLRTGKQIGHTFTHEDLDAMELKILGVASRMANLDFFHYTTNTFTCKVLCDHGKSGACPRGSNVIRKYS